VRVGGRGAGRRRGTASRTMPGRCTVPVRCARAGSRAPLPAQVPGLRWPGPHKRRRRRGAAPTPAHCSSRCRAGGPGVLLCGISLGEAKQAPLAAPRPRSAAPLCSAALLLHSVPPFRRSAAPPLRRSAAPPPPLRPRSGPGAGGRIGRRSASPPFSPLLCRLQHRPQPLPSASPPAVALAQARPPRYPRRRQRQRRRLKHPVRAREGAGRRRGCRARPARRLHRGAGAPPARPPAQ
jgi:hypothetical protein